MDAKQIKQTIYQHGGSRIWIEASGGTRELLADTYRDEAFALAVKKLADEWYLPPAAEHQEAPLLAGDDAASVRQDQRREPERSGP